MRLLRIGPGRCAGHDIELSEQAADDLISVLPTAELIEARQDPPQRRFGADDRVFGIVLALLPQAAPLLEKFLPVELDGGCRILPA